MVPGVEARDLTPAEAQARAEQCYEIEQRIKDAMHTGRTAIWMLAEALYDFDEERGWSALGYESLSHWLADPDIAMTRTTYYRMIGQWRALVIEHQIDRERLEELDVSKVEIVLPAVRAGKKTLEEALDDATTMGRRDLREEYFGPDRNREPESEVVPPSNGDQPVGRLAQLEAAIARADEALELPQRLGGSRQAVRQALVHLLSVLRHGRVDT